MLLPVCAALLLAPSPAMPVFEPVAVVVEASSRVQVRRLADPERRPATTGLRLSSGDSVFVPAGSMLVLLMRSGRMEQLSSSTVLPLRTGAPQGIGRVAMQSRTTPRQSDRIRPVEGGSAPIAPRNGIVVRADSLNLLWYRLEGAREYTVQLQASGADSFNRFDAGADTVWRPAPGQLQPGTTYNWTVFAGGGARVATPVSFRVIEDSTWQRVRAELAAVDSAVTTPQARLLLRALTFSDAGMLYDAAREFATLNAIGAPLPEDVAELYADVLQRIGRFEEAERVRPAG